ncbi:MAG: PAS domain-containing protein [Phycisphaerales bacterium]|nr:PAS domain-containing protein [Phycisphaerales bacterium]
MNSQERADSLLRSVEHISMRSLFAELMIGMYAVSIMVWDEKGTILCANEVAARGFQQPDPESLQGKSLHDFAPTSWANERYSVAKLAIQSGRRITFLEILGGYRLRTLIRPIRSQTDLNSHDCVLVTVEKITSSEYEYARSSKTNEMVVHANINDLGQLDVLTSRELEVLALMGQGLRAKEIAKELCRSVSTIDNHRDNIGVKLNIKDRGELIALAKLAALQVEDATRQRVQFSKYIPKNKSDSEPESEPESQSAPE